MGLLLVSCRWWRYPVEPHKARSLDHTGKCRAIYPVRRLSKAECKAHIVEEANGHYGPLREIKSGERAGEVNRGYPVSGRVARKSYTYEGRRPHLLWCEPVPRNDWRFKPLGRLASRAHCPPIRAPFKPPAGRVEASKLVLPGTWTFLGADRHYSERWSFTEKPRRKARPVPLTFKGEWDRLLTLPAWRGPARIYRIKGEVVGFRPVHFNWKPARQHYFGAWEQSRYVRRTRTPRPSTGNLRHFIRQKSFLQHRV